MSNVTIMTRDANGVDQPVSATNPLPTGAAGTTATEDAAAAANPAGMPVMLVREDARAGSLVTTDGDYVAQRGNNKGEAYVKDTDVATLLTTLGTGAGLSASAAFTPAAASHDAGDVNGAAGTFALAAPSGCVFQIQSATLLIAGGTIETTAWILHLFTVTPPSALADDAAFTLPSGDRASYVGKVDLAQVVDYGDSLWIESHNIGKRVKLAGTGLFGYLVNGTTLTPQAVAHTVTLIGQPVMS